MNEPCWLYLLIKWASCLPQPMKVVGIKAHTENDKGQVLLDLYIRWAVCLFLFCFLFFTLLVFLVGYVFLPDAAATLETLRSTSRSRGTSAKLEWMESRCVACSLPQKHPSTRLLQLLPEKSLWAHVICAAPSPASRHDAGDPGAADRRRAHRWSRHHVFHQAACTSASAHLCFPSSLPAIDWFLLDQYLLLRIAQLFVISLPRNWTSTGRDWRICWISLG